ncbi:HD domain-containing phosphohydrolase [Anaerolentibacter hominis]|uniref:HD domain-containing phosphohydrolase n=1 Tax=Anaerolentibacter hominis TaxID=3079009 RepID=UPI0031B83CFA
MELTPDLKKILDLGIALTSEKDYHRLLEQILTESMEITNCDAGTIYVREEDGLRFMVMRNKTMEKRQKESAEQVVLPKVPLHVENVCAYSSLHRKVVNIPDVYCSDEFDFQGPKYYDSITRYRTRSMLVIPLEDHEGESLGVIQLINAMDPDGNIVAFERKYEYIIYSLASEAAVTMANMRHMDDMKDLLNSMVSAFTTAIDERTPYNANHTKHVAQYAGELVDYINEQNRQEKSDLFFTEEEREQIVMAAMLHDIGKLIIPLEVINKSTRMDPELGTVLNRLELIRAWGKIDYLEGRTSREKWQAEDSYLDRMEKKIVWMDTAPFLDDESIALSREMAGHFYIDQEGRRHDYLTEKELDNLCIRKGTLTQTERRIMENHVVMTSKMLEQIHFGDKYSLVPVLAGQHHEYLNGSGYPGHLSSEELCHGSRMICILDIYDSLTSADRPYKKAIPEEKALVILNEMVREGKLDGELVTMWENYCRARGQEVVGDIPQPV